MITSTHLSCLCEAVLSSDDIVQDIMDKIDDIFSDYKGQALTLDGVLTVLNKQLYYDYGIVFQEVHSSDTDAMIPAAALGTDQHNSLVIGFYCDSALSTIFTDSESFKTFKKKFRGLLEHELVHKEQIIRRKLNNYHSLPTPELFSSDTITDSIIKKYLSDPTELMAYAKSITRALMDLGYDKGSILSLLRSGELVKIEELSYLFDTYLQIFKISDPPMKRLFSYIYQYAQKLD